MSTPDVQGILARAIRAAALSKPGIKRASSSTVKVVESSLVTTDKVVMVGASTGGTKAVEVLLKSLPRASPGMVICQHMPANFITTFARRLGEVSQMEVREAQDGDAVVLGRVLVAPGGSHTMLVRSGTKYIVRLKEGPPVHFQRPAVDVLFHSAARAAGANAVGILLTGMGSDGAAGLKAMRDAGAYTIVESEETCVVFGMPRAAIELGAATKVLPLHQVGPSFMEWVHANAI